MENHAHRVRQNALQLFRASRQKKAQVKRRSQTAQDPDFLKYILFGFFRLVLLFKVSVVEKQ